MILIRTIHAAGAVLALSLMVGCGDSQGNPIASTAANISNPDMMHLWQEGNCREPLALKLIGGSTRTTYEFSGIEVKKTEQYFATSDCTDLASTVVYIGSFDRKDELQKNVFQVNMLFNQVLVEAKNAGGQKVLNTAAFCGTSNWSINVPIDLTTHTRDSLCPLATLPQSIFDIYTIEDASLFFGKGDDKASADKRPTELNRDIIFHRL